MTLVPFFLNSLKVFKREFIYFLTNQGMQAKNAPGQGKKGKKGKKYLLSLYSFYSCQMASRKLMGKVI